MCLADYQMAQRTRTRVQAVTGGGLALPADPTRLRLVVSTATGLLVVYRGTTGNDPARQIATVGYNDTGGTVSYSGTLVMRVEDYGTMLLDNLFIFPFAAGFGDACMEVLALPDLDRTIQGK